MEQLNPQVGECSLPFAVCLFLLIGCGELTHRMHQYFCVLLEYRSPAIPPDGTNSISIHFGSRTTSRPPYVDALA